MDLAVFALLSVGLLGYTRMTRQVPAKREAPEQYATMKRRKQRVNMVFGTMLFGGQVDEITAEKMIERMVQYSLNEQLGKAILDTARLYQKGLTEQIIGRILSRREDLKVQVEIHTKADPSITPLTPEGLEKQLNLSLDALQVDSVQVYYLHMPQPSVQIEDTMRAMDSFVRRGLVKEIGLSNYPSWMVVYIDALCERNGWAKPTVYQGVYHLLSHNCEYELVPCLRYLGIRFHVFSPLCGGLLSGRYSSIEDAQSLTKGRFSPEYHNHHLYVNRYFNEENFQAIAKFSKCATDYKMTLLELSLSWFRHHSKLINGDAIVFGASSLNQLDEDLIAFSKGPLNEEILDVIDECADITRHVEAQYYRGYDKQHGRADEWLKQFR